MRRFTIAAVAMLAVAGSTAVYAQYRPFHHHHPRVSAEDMSAFADARIAALHAGLRLSPEQDKMWPAVESALRDLAKQRVDRANARMNAERGPDALAPDPIARLRQRAETMGARADALKRLAEAADPLYRSLDDGQKRRLAALTRGPWGRMMGGPEEPRFNRDFDRDGPRGFERRERDHDRDRGPFGGPERL